MEEVKVKCRENNILYSGVLDRYRKACGEDVSVNMDNLFFVHDVGYFSEDIERYYVLCPNCGYMVLVDNDLLSLNMKDCAKDKNNMHSYVFRKNKLMSEIMYYDYLERNEKKVKTRIRK